MKHKAIKQKVSHKEKMILFTANSLLISEV